MVIDGLGMREKQTLSSGNWRQKLGEGVEWDSGKVTLLELVRKNLSDWQMDWRLSKEWCQCHRKTNTRDEKGRISKVYGKSKRLPWNWRRVARVLDITTHVENPCYMLRTGPSAIFNFRWLILSHAFVVVFPPCRARYSRQKGNTLQGSERFPLSLHGKWIIIIVK